MEWWGLSSGECEICKKSHNMPYSLYYYVDSSGANTINDWLDSLQKGQRAKVDQRLDMLTEHGDGLLPMLLSPSNIASILKLRIHGNVQLRPLLCRGPAAGDIDTYTLLAGAAEVGFKLTPKNILNVAVARRAEVKDDPTNRRCRRA